MAFDDDARVPKDLGSLQSAIDAFRDQYLAVAQQIDPSLDRSFIATGRLGRAKQILEGVRPSVLCGIMLQHMAALSSDCVANTQVCTGDMLSDKSE